MSKSLGRVPKTFKDNHVCHNCGAFEPLWDLTYQKWCDACVRDAGGLMAAGRVVRDDWYQSRNTERRERGLAPISHPRLRKPEVSGDVIEKGDKKPPNSPEPPSGQAKPPKPPRRHPGLSRTTIS